MKSRFQFRVEKAVVFGPYLTGAEKLNNVDDALALRPKVKDRHELEARVKADADRAAPDGKRFKSFADRRAWGAIKVREHFKQRTRSIALHELNDAILAQQHRVVFER